MGFSAPEVEALILASGYDEYGDEIYTIMILENKQIIQEVSLDGIE